MTVRHLAAGCLLLAVPSVAAAQAGNRFELRREIPEGGLVVLRNIIGPVQLQPAPGRTLEVSGVKKEGRHGDPEDVEIRTVELEKGVAICVFYPSDWGSRDRHYIQRIRANPGSELLPERAAEGRNPVARESRAVRRARPGRFLHVGQQLHPGRRAGQSAGGVCTDVRSAARFSGGAPADRGRSRPATRTTPSSARLLAQAGM